MSDPTTDDADGAVTPVFTAKAGRLASMPRLMALDHQGQLTSAHVRLVATAVGRSERTVWNWIKVARATGRTDAQRRPRFTVTPEIRRLLGLWGGNASAVLRELQKRAAADPQQPQVPSLATLHKALRRDLAPGDRAGLAQGEAARRAFDVFGQRPSGNRNEAWEGDHKCVPVKVWVEDELVQPCLTWFIDCARKVIMGWAVTPHEASRDAVLAALRTALDRSEPFGPAGGLPGLVRVDRGKEFLCAPVTLALGAFAVPVVDLPAYSPHLKGTIEALNDSVEEMLFVSMPRYTSQQKLTGGRTADPDEPALTFEAFVGLLQEWVRWWNYEHKPDKLNGLTPIEAWRADPTPLYDVSAQQLAHFGLEDDGSTRVITTHGVQWRNHAYIAPWMVGMGGTRVAVRHLPHHDASIEVFGLDGTYLGSGVLAEQASQEQVRAVRNVRKAKERRLRADLKAAARLRRDRFEAVTSATPPQRLGALTEAEAEAELAGESTAALRRADPGYIPHAAVPDGWARPVPADPPPPAESPLEEGE
ncbi:Mu transposase C-terminal domain-containing protein [Streptomyces sp. NRRL F-5193]|uniref:Mu transposase C-terminal domain-containing protein n=1 Tax=Streptomyces sp. NRRL F-5193 TaxID=1463860 RepID=UPI001F17414F|nr:Mu transposase C-terminal domain-containing protein [Streptomyces sp. NRRL F-5193]